MKKHVWYKKRGYPHFDFPLDLRSAKRVVREFRKNPRLHNFLPLIYYEIIEPKRDPETKKVKREGKVRPIAYPSHSDAAIYSSYCFILNTKYQKWLRGSGLSDSILAYRTDLRGRSNLHFAVSVFREISCQGECAAIAFDIKGFFDHLLHARLYELWCKLLTQNKLPADHFRVFKAITRATRLNRDKLYVALNISGTRAREMRQISHAAGESLPIYQLRALLKNKNLYEKQSTLGIAQGTPISAMLSNLYMMDTDLTIKSFLQEHCATYRRYSDDILIICKEHQIFEITKFVKQQLASVGLELAPKKTQERVFRIQDNGLVALGREVEEGVEVWKEKPLDYLGLLFDGRRALLRQKSLNKYYRRMKSAVRSAARAARRARLAGGDGNIRRRSLYLKYTHFGNKNFVRYAIKASNVAGPLGHTCRRQVRRHLINLKKLLDRA